MLSTVSSYSGQYRRLNPTPHFSAALRPVSDVKLYFPDKLLELIAAEGDVLVLDELDEDVFIEKFTREGLDIKHAAHIGTANWYDTLESMAKSTEPLEGIMAPNGELTLYQKKENGSVVQVFFPGINEEIPGWIKKIAKSMNVNKFDLNVAIAQRAAIQVFENFNEATIIRPRDAKSKTKVVVLTNPFANADLHQAGYRLNPGLYPIYQTEKEPVDLLGAPVYLNIAKSGEATIKLGEFDDTPACEAEEPLILNQDNSEPLILSMEHADEQLDRHSDRLDAALSRMRKIGD